MIQVVEQVIESDWRGVFDKEVHEVTSPIGDRVAMVRKREHGRSGILPCVLCIHGFAQNRYSWHTSRRSFTSYLAAHGYDVFNVDLRGQGRSRVVGRIPYGFDDFIAHDIPACVSHIRELNGGRKVFLAGHSMGGAISCGVAGEIPEQIAGVILIAPLYRFPRGAPMIRMLTGLVRMFDNVAPVEAPNAPLPLDILGWWLARRMDIMDHRRNRFQMMPWQMGSTDRSLLAERVSKGFERQSAHVLFAIARFAGKETVYSESRAIDYLERFAHLNLPLFVMSGDKDFLAPTSNCRPAHDESLSQDKMFIEYGAGNAGAHFGHLDLIVGDMAPKTVWVDILAWMDQRREHGG
ncbi:MAG: 2-succinyl-6-hydroxy-2,4-cyclohexadiene-1-carboxylate synthase [Myxococcota bacterium]|nr:2-succinyl-6-hydroxy-2,4-cyclohexadiene-1-carboxylate synthase [Myxococcota bacterium]